MQPPLSDEEVELGPLSILCGAMTRLWVCPHPPQFLNYCFICTERCQEPHE